MFFDHASSLCGDSPETPAATVYSEDGELVGRIIRTRPLTEGIVGYAGEIALLIALDNQDSIVDVQIEKHRETPSYIDYIQSRNFLNNWTGLSVHQAVNRDIAAVTGATMSCDAIEKSLRRSLAEIYDIDYVELGRHKAGFPLRQVLGFGCLLAAVFCAFGVRFFTRQRTIFLIANIVILGFANGCLLSLSAIVNLLGGSLSLFDQSLLFLIALVVILWLMLTGKNLYCLWICPLGACQELAGKNQANKKTLSAEVRQIIYVVRNLYWLAIVVFIAAAMECSFFEPFAAFSMRACSGWHLLFAGSIILASAFTPKVWCRFLCPTGYLLNLLRLKRHKL